MGMTTTSSFETPTIDTLISSLEPKIGHYAAQRFEQGKQIVALAVEAGSIFNIDFQDAKDSLSRSIERVWDDLSFSLRAPYRDNRDSEEFSLLWELPTSIQLHLVAGYLRKAEKLAQKIPTLVTYVSVLQELLPISEALDSLKPLVVKGRKPLENPKPVDNSNTGTCAICQHIQKLSAGKNLVHHGFTISDGRGRYFGFRNGRCFGYGLKPYELSNEANVKFIQYLNDLIHDGEKGLAHLKSGKVTELSQLERIRENGQRVEKLVTYKVGEPRFAEVLRERIAHSKFRIESWRLEIERQELLTKNWELKPLPDEVF